MLDCQFCDLVSKGPDVIMNELNIFTIANSKIHTHTPFTPVLVETTTLSSNLHSTVRSREISDVISDVVLTDF